MRLIACATGACPASGVSRRSAGRIRTDSISDVESSTPLSYFGTESFDISAKASFTVVMNCAGKMIVEFFSTEISAIV